MLEINKNPSSKDLAWFGLLLLVFLGIVGSIVYWKFDAPSVARVLWVTGTVLCLIYYAIPPVRKPMYLGWMYLAFPIAWTISHVLLAVAFYVVFTIIGLVMRSVGKDPMHRRFDRQAETYWVKHDPGSDPTRYFRQY